MLMMFAKQYPSLGWSLSSLRQSGLRQTPALLPVVFSKCSQNVSLHHKLHGHQIGGLTHSHALQSRAHASLAWCGYAQHCGDFVAGVGDVVLVNVVEQLALAV